MFHENVQFFVTKYLFIFKGYYGMCLAMMLIQSSIYAGAHQHVMLVFHLLLEHMQGHKGIFPRPQMFTPDKLTPCTVFYQHTCLKQCSTTCTSPVPGPHISRKACIVCLQSFFCIL